MFVAELYGLPAARAAENIEQQIATFELADFVDDLTESYSHGMKQRLVFASALVHQPQVLIVDEPMVGLDPRSMRLGQGPAAGESPARDDGVHVDAHAGHCRGDRRSHRRGLARPIDLPGNGGPAPQASSPATNRSNSFSWRLTEEAMDDGARQAVKRPASRRQREASGCCLVSGETCLFWRLRLQIGRSLLHAALATARLQIFSVMLATCLLWIGLFLLFFGGFFLLQSGLVHAGMRAQLTHAVFNLFFLALTVMLIFSAAIILYGGLFRSDEVTHLLTTPATPERIVRHKFEETAFFSCWGFLLLASPMLLAYGVVVQAPLLLLPAAAAVHHRVRTGSGRAGRPSVPGRRAVDPDGSRARPGESGGPRADRRRFLRLADTRL